MTTAQPIYVAGENGYHTYRIPSILTLPDGRVLAFCEGRRNSSADYGKIDIVARISNDGAHTYGPQRVIAQWGEETVGNPTPVYDRDTGRIWLFLNTNLAAGPEREICLNRAPRSVGAIYSDDRGETWSLIQDMTPFLKLPGWTWYATGPCHALQMKDGRLVIPCNHGEFDEERSMTPVYRPHVILSDDHGKTWRLGGIVEEACANESTVEQLSDGRLYLNARSMNERPFRVASVSDDGGEHWRDTREDDALPDPMCQACVIAYPAPIDGCLRPLLFTNNPNVPGEDFGAPRKNLSVRLSLDDGQSWSKGLCIHQGPTAYGDLTILKDGSIACLYECGEAHPYERIAQKILTVDEIKMGKP